MQLDAKGRADESLAVEFVGPLRSKSEDSLRNKKLVFNLQKGQLKANICYQPLQSANLEVKFIYKKKLGGKICFLLIFPF